MTEHKYVLKQISTYTGEPHILYQKEFESRERAEMYRDIIEPILTETQASSPALPYITYVIEEL